MKTFDLNRSGMLEYEEVVVLVRTLIPGILIADLRFILANLCAFTAPRNSLASPHTAMTPAARDLTAATDLIDHMLPLPAAHIACVEFRLSCRLSCRICANLSDLVDVDGKGALSVDDLGRVADLPADTVSQIAAQYEMQCLDHLESASVLGAAPPPPPEREHSGAASAVTRPSTVGTRATSRTRGRSVRSVRKFLDEVRADTDTDTGHGLLWEAACVCICAAAVLFCACAPLPSNLLSHFSRFLQSGEGAVSIAIRPPPTSEFAKHDWQDTKQNHLGDWAGADSVGVVNNSFFQRKVAQGLLSSSQSRGPQAALPPGGAAPASARAKPGKKKSSLSSFMYQPGMDEEQKPGASSPPRARVAPSARL